MQNLDADGARAAVRETYGAIAAGEKNGCCSSDCCGGDKRPTSAGLGYSEQARQSVPAGADLGLGCGNPLAIAKLKPGDRVLDLGSGAGFDALLAGQAVGARGQVIGVDMTAGMVARARRNAGTAGLSNVEFRLGEIEHLPVADASMDVILSNCVINLSPDKPAVFREAFRVLAPGGRLAISDIVAVLPLPAALQQDLAAYAGCIAGAAPLADVERMLREAGFAEVHVDINADSREVVDGWLPGLSAGDYVASAHIEAVKP